MGGAVLSSKHIVMGRARGAMDVVASLYGDVALSMLV